MEQLKRERDNAREKQKLELETFKQNMENAQNVIKSRQDLLEVAQKNMEAERKKNMRLKTDVAAIQREIADKVGSTLTLYEVKRLLQVVRSTVAALQKSWKHLIQYFDRMKTNIDKALGDELRTFVDRATTTAEVTKAGPYGGFVYELIKKSSINTVSMAYIIEEQTELYLNVSQNLIMSPLSNLQKLLVMNNEEEIDRVNKALLEEMKNAEEEIQGIVDEAEENFEESAKQRIIAMHDKLQSLQSTAIADINNSVGQYNKQQKQEGKPAFQPRTGRQRSIPGVQQRPTERGSKNWGGIPGMN